MSIANSLNIIHTNIYIQLTFHLAIYIGNAKWWPSNKVSHICDI